MNTTNKHDAAFFTELQRFSNKSFINFIIIVEPLLIIALVFLFQNNPALMIVLGLAAILPVVILLLALNTKLESNIDRHGVRFRWFPFQKSFNKIKWQEIEEAKVIDHGFKGYGWRMSKEYGNVHIVWGNQGLFIQLKNRSKYLIGTQKPEELKDTLSHLPQANN